MAGYLDEVGLQKVVTSLKSDINKRLPTSGGTISGNLAVTGSFTVNGKTIDDYVKSTVDQSVTKVLNKAY